MTMTSAEVRQAFLDYFEDLNKSTNFMKNEYILKHFFMPTDPRLRKEITTITVM